MTELLRPRVWIFFSNFCWICVENPVSPPARPVLRGLKVAVCTPLSRTATRGGEVGLGVCVAAARITPHCAGGAAWRRGS